MKRHIDLPQLVAELQSEQKQKHDLIIPSSCLSMKEGKIIVENEIKNPELDKILYNTGISQVRSNQQISLDCLPVVDEHLSEKLGIPSRYFQKMREGHTDLLDRNVAYWFEKSKNNFLLRTFIDKEGGSGVARALLSDRFRAIDNYDILLATISAIQETGLNVQIDQGGADISDKRLYLRFVCPAVEISSPKLLKGYRPNGEKTQRGDGIISGFVISNSEVGAGALTIAARMVVLACGNGMIKTDEKFNQRHLGTKMEQFSSVDWSTDTREKNLELIISQIRDTIKHFVSEEFLGSWITDLENKGSKDVEHPADCIKQVSQSMGFSEDRANDILSIFIKSGDTSAFGVAQAFTYHAQHQEDPDMQWDIERQACEILDNIAEYDKPLARKSNKTLTQLN